MPTVPNLIRRSNAIPVKISESKSLIFLDIEAESDMDALKQIAVKFYDNGNVKESYLEAIQKREKIYNNLIYIQLE